MSLETHLIHALLVVVFDDVLLGLVLDHLFFAYFNLGLVFVSLLHSARAIVL